MEEVLKNEVKEFRLPDNKVTVRLVKRARGAIKDPTHVLFNLAPGATVEICPRNKKGSSVVDCPLTSEEITFFENKQKSGMAFEIGELSPHAADKVNFWRSRKAKVVLSDRDRVLDLSNASDYLAWKILLGNPDIIAPSADQEFAKKSYIFVITSDEEVQKKAVKSGNEKKRAWKIAAKLEDDRQGMIDFLTIVGKRPSANAKIDFLNAEIDKYIESNIKNFLEILENPQYETQVLLTKSLQNKSVTRDGHKYYLAGGDELCNKGDINNLANTLNFLDADENQDIRLMLVAKLEK